MRIVLKKSLGKQKTCDIVGSKTGNYVLSNGVVVHNSSVIDEANFLEVIEGSKKSEKFVYDAAEAMFNATYNRMISRFMKAGKVPGFVVMISSRKSRNSFMERKIKEGIERKADPDNGIFFRVKNLWECKPKEYYPSNEYFYFDTDTLAILPTSRGEHLYHIQKELIESKVRAGIIEPEMVGLIDFGPDS